ncbi:uncharacterized protein METZ01_LOCUS264733 [marine metagenome]|uniref:Uncharacterized protein n=1 Tax=marine metagenome TaxID=408172 RepID=A0A382JJK2_9ZZZZ
MIRLDGTYTPLSPVLGLRAFLFSACFFVEKVPIESLNSTRSPFLSDCFISLKMIFNSFSKSLDKKFT